MKKTLLKTSFVLLLAASVIISCKKKTDDTATPDDTAEQSTNGGDDSRVQTESDAAISDADVALSGNSSTMRTSGVVYHTLCGISSIDSTQKGSGKLTIFYDGSVECNGRKRTGSITLQLSGTSKWTNAGAVLSMTFNNYTVTRIADSKVIVFSGTKYVTNVNGGLISTMTQGGSAIVHKIQSPGLKITFDDGTSRTWGIARTRTITHPTSTGYMISTQGDSTVSGVSGVAIAGTTRLGSPFYTDIVNPIVWNTDQCLYAPISGTRILKGIARQITITYGVDANGNAVTTGCPYGTKLVWDSISGSIKTVIVLY